MSELHILEVEINAEGGELAYIGVEGAGCGYRIAGPKAWGGSRSLAKLKIKKEDLAEYVKNYAPETRDLICQSELERIQQLEARVKDLESRLANLTTYASEMNMAFKESDFDRANEAWRSLNIDAQNKIESLEENYNG